MPAMNNEYKTLVTEDVVSYGKSYGFKVLQIREQDDEWEEKVLKRVEQLSKRP